MPPAPFDNPLVAARFEALPGSLRQPLLHLRQTILDVAAGLPQLGGLIETLKWSEPAYHPVKARVGTTIRINAHRGSLSCYALYVPCQTQLAAMIRQHYPETFSIEGSRALLFDVEATIPAEPLHYCIAMALTYHLQAKRGA
ncbi:hypothetical protein GCM10007874_19400 [Labrys miyagiensis]|uniref:YdhG-like domain-containing protein n=1 Tax=Labrys miyagiensis TaxID=346912 RepID=A0ABQ6CGV1_9HYPH|nr:DUF1801 domain-containing protein [Labrys miyagiensis]GLS18923.1 hypothetical protein GCM10007874_19400 [Labrys miyagiensis]